MKDNPERAQSMKTNPAETKAIKTQIQYLLVSFGLFFFSELSTYAVVTLSTGHVDGFEVHYDPAAVSPEEPFGLHIHDDTTNTHYEPADVVLQVNQSAFGVYGDVFTSSTRLGWTGESGWVLPSIQSETVDEVGDPAMLFLGVASDGGGVVWAGNQFKISLISVGANNPGDFAMYRFSGSGSFSNPINTKNGVSSSDVLTVSSIGGHEHWNWAFSEAGEYTLNFQASGLLGDTLFQSAVETYTFNVIPEPTCGTLLLTAFSMGMSLRRRFFRS
jgi:surface-anchored protein